LPGGEPPPVAEDHAAPSVTQYHQPLRGLVR
jgi:hypothetical protein